MTVNKIYILVRSSWRMSSINKLVFQAPSIIDPELAQIDSRVKEGYMPYVMVTRLPPKEDKVKTAAFEENVKKFLKYIQNNNVAVSFDIGNCFGKPVEESIERLKVVDSIRKQAPEHISKGIKMKCDSAVAFPKATILEPGVNCTQYESAHQKTLDAMKQLYAAAQRLGVALEIENRPRPDYTLADKKTPKNILDPQIRWNNEWSARPKFEVEVFSDASEIVGFMREFENAKLQLDIEHLVQNIQYGNIFSLENANDGILKAGDLNDEQKKILRSYGIPCKDSQVIFDYSKLSREEIKFLKKFGYVIRKDQPLIYERKVTLEGELETIVENQTPLRSISPGFQVYQGFYDIRDGKEVLLIGSHMPGIISKYIKNDEVRVSLQEKIRAIHALVWNFIKKNGIKIIELEPQVDDGTKTVYSGQKWSKQTSEMVSQIKENLFLAETDNIDLNKGPVYLR